MDKQLYSVNDPSTSRTNMVNFGLVTPEIECENFVLLNRYGKKRPISPNISATTEPIITNVSLWYGDYKTD